MILRWFGNIVKFFLSLLLGVAGLAFVLVHMDDKQPITFYLTNVRDVFSLLCLSLGFALCLIGWYVKYRWGASAATAGMFLLVVAALSIWGL